MNSKKEIVKKIQNLSGKYSPYDIFCDWVTMMALTLQNSCDLLRKKVWEIREKQYKDIIGKYSNTEQREFTVMYALLVTAFEENISDILGEIYMESGCGNKNTGQFFTPFHLSLVCAKLAIPKVDENGRIMLNEPSCGGGGMIIATAVALRDRGENYQRLLDVVAQDLDWKAVYMCYVQLSLLGIKATVVQGDTLAYPYSGQYPSERVFQTPAKMGMLI